MNKGEKSLSFFDPTLNHLELPSACLPVPYFLEIKKWYSMYIFVQTCTYFLEIITVGVMYILVQTCTVRICMWTLNREKIVS